MEEKDTTSCVYSGYPSVHKTEGSTPSIPFPAKEKGREGKRGQRKGTKCGEKLREKNTTELRISPSNPSLNARSILTAAIREGTPTPPSVSRVGPIPSARRAAPPNGIRTHAKEDPEPIWEIPSGWGGSDAVIWCHLLHWVLLLARGEGGGAVQVIEVH